MAREIKDISGIKFSRILVLRFEKRVDKTTFWFCKCDCGTERIIDGRSLIKGQTKSCGCLKKEIDLARVVGKRENMSEYKSWSSMKNRCYNENCEQYHNYGGRGISVCERWIHSFPNFLSDMGKKPTLKHSIDRVNVNGNYDPSNCRWATMKEQQNNRRNNKKTGVLRTPVSDNSCGITSPAN